MLLFLTIYNTFLDDNKVDCQEIKDYHECTSEVYKARVLEECKCLPFSMTKNKVSFLQIKFQVCKNLLGAIMHSRDVEMCRKYG